MTQVDFKLFLTLRVQAIQASPNFVRYFINSWVLYQIYPNLYRKDIEGIFNPTNLFFSLILNLPLDSSPCFNVENNDFHNKTFSSLVFGDDFTSTGTT